MKEMGLKYTWKYAKIHQKFRWNALGMFVLCYQPNIPKGWKKDWRNPAFLCAIGTFG